MMAKIGRRNQLVVLSAVDPVGIIRSKNGNPKLSEQDERKDNMDHFNHPRERRALILSALEKQSSESATKCLHGSNAQEILFEVPDSIKCLDMYKLAHDSEGLLAFLETAWTRWDALGEAGQDLSGCLTDRQADNGNDTSRTPPLIPSNTILPRDESNTLQRPSKHVLGQIGYYCTDTCTPIFEDLLVELLQDGGSLQRAVDLILVGNDEETHSSGGAIPTLFIIPNHPGHHSAYNSFGGYCYVNHVATLARMLQVQSQAQQAAFADKADGSDTGGSVIRKVAILDVDYHCGNGTASILYQDPSIYVVSIHCDPDYDYPFHSGFADEVGKGKGAGFTKHLPLPPGTKWKEYHEALKEGLDAIQKFGAQVLLVSLGLDTHTGDPCSIRRAGFQLQDNDYVEMGKTIARYSGGIPTIFLLEGGYRMNKIGQAATDVVTSFCEDRLNEF